MDVMKQDEKNDERKSKSDAMTQDESQNKGKSKVDILTEKLAKIFIKHGLPKPVWEDPEPNHYIAIFRLPIKEEDDDSEIEKQ